MRRDETGFFLTPGDAGRVVELRSRKRKAEGGGKEVAEGRGRRSGCLREVL